MTGSGVVAESGPMTYSPNALTKSLATREMGGMVEAMYAVFFLS